MKKNFKRWLALLLAVIMVASTGLSHADGFLKATEGEVTEVTEGTEELVIADETVEGEKEEPVEDVQTLEVPKNPEEVTEESQEPEASQPTETPETSAEPETPQTAETPEEPQAPEAQEEPVETPEEITYQVVFNEPKLAGGTISVWAEGEEKQAVSYNNGKFTKEVKEGDTLYFEITNADNYAVEKVTDQAGEALKSEKTAEKTSTYKMVVKAQNEITVVYKEVKSNTAAADGETTEIKPEKPITFNAQDESDRLLGEDRAEKEYPEYLTATEVGGRHDRCPHIPMGSGFLNLKKNGEKWECLVDPTWGDGPRHQHYISLSENATGDEISYVRCDVYGGEQGGETYYEVTFINTKTNETVNKSVKKDTYPTEIPNWGNGYWTAAENGTEKDKIDPTSYNIDGKGDGLQGPATYYWHEKKEAPKYTITTSADTNSTITPTQTEIPQGEDRTITYSANKGYKIKEIKVDGTPVDLEQYKQSYTFTNINANHTISVTTEKLQKQTVTITGNTKTVDYNGQEQEVTGFMYEAPEGINVSLKEGVKAEVKGTDANTEPYYMGLTKDSFNVTSDKYSDIEVIVNDGWLKINPNSTEVNVVVTGNTRTVDYNGQEQEVTNFTTNAPEGVTVTLAEGKVARAAGTDAGTYKMNLTIDDFTVSSQNYSNVKIVEVVDGWLKINKSNKPVTACVVGNTDTKNYTGTELEVTGFTTIAPNGVTVELAEGKVARAAGTNAQEAPYMMGLEAADFVATSKNYENINIVVKQDGWLKINPTDEELVVNITGNTATVEYTGSEQSITGFTHDAKDSSVTVDLKKDKEAVAKGTDANINPYYMGLAAEDFTVTSPNYTNITVNVTDGWLKIDPTDKELVVNVKGKTLTANYTGKPQHVEGFEVLDAPESVTVALAEGKTARAEGTDVATYYMGLNSECFVATSPNYTNIKVNVTDGWLKIDQKDTLIVEVTGKNKTVTYNGGEQSVTGFTSDAPKDVKVELKKDSKAEAKGTNAATYYMDLKPEDFTATSKNYKNITISIKEDGFLTITPITAETTVEIEGNTDTKNYTGTEQKVEGFTSNAKTIDNTIQVALANGSKAEAKGTVVGTYKMNLTEKDFVLSSPNYTNLKANVTDGWLKINPTDEKLTVTITGENASKEYTGSEQSISGFTYAATDDSVTVALKKGKEAVAKGTVVGHYPMGLTKDFFEVTSDNYSNIEVVVVDGYLDITPTDEKLTVTITGANASKEYNGSEQSISGFTYAAEDDSVTVALKKGKEAVAKGTVVGHYPMGLTKDSFEVTSDNYSNIEVVVVDGYLDITPTDEKLTVTITGNHDSKVYTGVEQNVTGFKSNAPRNVSVKFVGGKEAVAKGTVVGHYPMGLTEDSFEVTSDNYSNIEVKVVDGYLDITPITEKLTVTITGNHESKVYTGVEQSVTGFKSNAPKNVSVKLADGKEAVARGTVVGKYWMGLTKDSFEVTSDNYSNIEVVVVDGYLEITPITEKLTVTITGNHASKVYTGVEQSVTGFESNAPANVNVKLVDREEAVARGTVVDRYPMGLTENSFEVTSANYSNIEVKVVDGYLDITPITETLTVTITGANESKVYTGVEQSVTGFESDAPANVSVKLVEGKEAVAKGTVVGHYPMGLTKDSFEVTSDNYSNIEVEVVDGYLDITPITEKLTVTITGNNKTETYNGKPWTVKGFSHDAPANVSVNLVDGANAEVTKTEAGNYPMGLTKESFEVTSANYSDIEVVVVDGYLQINPADTLTVHVKGTQEDKVYNGKEWVVTGFIVEDAPDDVEITLKEGIKAEAKGTDVATYYMNLDKEDFEVKASNYSKVDLVVEDGWLNITPNTEEVVVKVTGNHDSKPYNGKEQSVTGFTSNAKEIDKTIEVKLAEGSKAEAKGTVVSDQPYKMGLKATDFTATSKNYTNLKVDVTDGYLEITPNTKEVVVKVTGNHDSKPYNGQEQSVTGFTSNAETIDKTIEVKLAEGSKAEAKGTVVSDQPYKMGLKATDFTATSKNYTNLKVDVTDGYLTITPIEAAITLTADSGEKVYDGTALTKGTFTSDGENILVSGDTITAVVEGSRTDAGTADNVITSHRVVRTIGEKTVDVTNCYNFKPYEKGLLEVTKRPITVEAESETKTFNNIPLVNEGYKLTVGTLAPTQSAVVTVEGSQLYVGSSPNEVKEVKIYTFEMKDVTSNYNITSVDGTLTVTDGTETDPIDPNKVVTKTHENKEYGLGDTIEFTITVTNIYDKAKTITIVEQEGVTITGDAVFENVAPGAVVTTTAKYVVTEEDILAGSFTNHVTAQFEGGKEFEDTDEVTELTDKNGHLSIIKTTISTPANGSAYVLGETITYKITVTNDGNLTIKDIVVNDELTGNIGDNAWTIESLAPGESREFTAEYVVTEADLLIGSVKNEATATGTSPDLEKPEVPVTPGEKDDPTVKAEPSLFVEKKAEPKANGEAFNLGDKVNYTIKVVNNGNLTIKDINVTDELTNGNWKVASLAPGASETFTTTYTVTEADLVNDQILNEAVATGTANNLPIKAADVETVSTISATSHITINKTTTSTPKDEKGYALGEVIKYEITVTNDGNQTLKNVVVTDELTGDEWTIETLAPGAIETFTAEYKVTADDIVTGSVQNVATATADKENPGSPDPEVTPGTTDDKTEDEKPALTSTKALTNEGTGTDGKFKVNDTAKFDITVTNTGNVTLNGVRVTEQLSGAKIVAGKGYTVSEDGTVATITTLKVGETVVVKATYVVKQADVDNGGVKNIAFVEGDGAGTTDPKPVDPEVTVPTEPQNPDFTSKKKLTNKGTGFLGKFKVGETATFDITVANTGNVTLKNITVKEQLAGANIVAGTGYTINEAGVAVIDTLDVGATVVVKAEYVITQEDVDNGGVKNKVAVNGNGPDEEKNPQPETPEEEIKTDDKKPTATTDKILTNFGSGENGSFKVGETAEFDITVQNTGNVTLKNVVVKEMLNGAKIVAGEGYTVSADGKSATIVTIKVGETATVKAVYTMTQADVDNGQVINTADVEVPGKPDPQKPTEPIPTDPQKPAFTATKTLTNEGTGSGENGNFKVGDIAKFDITVTNTGNITLNNVKVKEQLAGAKFVKGDGYTVSADGTTATIQTMEVGATVLLKAEYTITQEDVDQGSAVNSIIVEGEGTGDKDPEPVDPEEPIPTDPQKPALTSTKALTNEGTGTEGKFKVGDTAEFDITVTNTGNVTLNDVTVTEQLSGAKIVAGKGYTVSADGTFATIDTLNVGETIVVKATYVVTQADVDNGGVKNIASVEGEGTGGKDPEPVDPQEPIPTEPQKPNFASEKELTNEGTGKDGKFKVGETAKFDITVENNGNVTLKNIKVTEQLAGAVILAGDGYRVVDNVAVIDTLDVGATVVVKAEYMITQEDVDSDGVKNIASVEGEGAGDKDPKPVDPEEPIPTDDKKPTAITAKTLTNSGSGENGSFKVGETAEFDITVENTGNVTLKDVVVKEMLDGAKIVEGEGYTVSADGKSATIATIKVGETATVKAVYTITQADVDNGQVINTADVEVPGKTDPQSPDEPIVTDPQKPAFTATKTLTNEGTGKDGKFKVGDIAEFDIDVENSGNVTLKDVVVKEMLDGAKIVEGEGYTVSEDSKTATIEAIEVGKTVTVKAIYEITQADVDNGGVTNSVAVEGNGPDTEDPKPQPEKPEEVIPTEDPDPKMSVEKEVTSSPRADGEYYINDKITYKITVTNTGNVTLNDVIVQDKLNASGQVTWETGITVNEKNEAVIGSMKPGETVTLNCSYVVTAADAGKDLVNAAIGDSTETDPTPPSTTDPTEVESYYNLTINYVYADGSEAAPSVHAQYLKGESFGYASPVIDGFTPDYAFVRTGAEGMPAQDVTVVVTYTANPVPVVPVPNPETPTDPTPGVVTPDNGTTGTPGGAGQTGTPAAQTPAQGTPEEPVGAEIGVNEDGELEIVPVIDEEVPLADRELDEHECCMLHFLLMLAAMIVYAFYTRSMKKRQARIAELADQLETELLKRKQETAE